MDEEESIRMDTTFSKEEMIQANQFRTISQKALQQQLRKHAKIGVLFPSTGLSAVMMSYERYEALIKRLNELENALEDIEIAKTYGSRLQTPEEEWINHPEGVSTVELYRQRQKERTGQ
ncbi:hypothetical protein [Alicyclobacillus macrosporangiidus]|uniref:hypothetical protein n=1 Tax=Alicyclobacillus macrosporangiidus TaxID=392015 RepID=UPI0004961DBE|nr:hypothetical protein [Alicyclobacillus macrosporangiidus]